MVAGLRDAFAAAEATPDCRAIVITGGEGVFADDGFGASGALALNKVLASVISLEALNWWLPLLCSAVLLVCVTVATWYPARIATSVSPATATKAL